MKTDYLSCTKMLYFAEKILQDNYTDPPMSDPFVKLLGLSPEEALEITTKLEKNNLLVFHDCSTEIEDEHGNMIGEVSYDARSIDKEAMRAQIEHTKKQYRLREKPFIQRERVVLIANQIEKIFSKDQWMQIISADYAAGDVVYYFHTEKYTLVDFLFRLAYETEEAQKFPAILAEFLNPIYYDIHSVDTAKELFDYIDKVLAISATNEDYEKWLVKAAKYVYEIGSAGTGKRQSLKGKHVTFDETKPAIMIGDKSCPLPPAKNEYDLVRVVFSRPIGEFVDWSIIHHEMTGNTEIIGNEKDKKMVRDTMDRLNKRVQDVFETEDEILNWENKSIRRNF